MAKKSIGNRNQKRIAMNLKFANKRNKLKKIVMNKKELVKAIKDKKVAKMNFCNTQKCEEKIKVETKASSRCILKNSSGKCANCNSNAEVEIYFSKSY